MFEMSTLVVICALYVAVLFAIATWTESKARAGKNIAANPWIYSLSLAVICTTWTYYGSVGYAANSGMLFLTTYLGPTLSAVLWWTLLRKLVRLKDRFRITSIADLISARYGKSRLIAALVTLVAVVGITPYVALQFRAMTTTAVIVTGHDVTSEYVHVESQIGLLFTAMMILFTIVFGIRRINPTERHPGMMVALSVESIVKLAAFMAGGIYIAISLFGGFGEAFEAAQRYLGSTRFVGQGTGSEFMQWISHLFLGFGAILLLPRQFHVAVIENSDEKHIRTAMWLFPLYLLIINLFVVPIAGAGLSFGFTASEADTFVTKLIADQKWLSIFVFIGGFSAGTGMIMIETVAIATMVVNHLVLPISSSVRGLGGLRRYLLQCRWAAAALFILAGYLYERYFAQDRYLISIGLISFAAVLQFMPALIGGLYWRNANKYGAGLGMLGGIAVWAYTLALPSLFAKSWMGPDFMKSGLFGLSFLRPGQLFGLEHLDPVTHSVFWSMVVNIALYVLGSIVVRTSTEDDDIATQFVAVMEKSPQHRASLLPGQIDSSKKKRQIESLFTKYFDPQTAAVLTRTCFRKSDTENKDLLSILELAELQAEAERTLAASIGTATAHAAIRAENIITEEESKKLSNQYATILADMNVSPAELRTRIDYYRERERILSRQASTFRLLSEISQKLTSSLEYEATLSTVARVPVPAICECVLLYLAEEPLPGEGPKPKWVVAHANPQTETELRERFERICPDPTKFDPIARALDTRRSVSIAPDSAYKWNAELFQNVKIGSSITLPLIARNSMSGTLSLLSSRPNVLQYSDEIAAIEELAYRCAIAIDNSRLYRNAQAAIRAREEFVSIASHELRTPLTPLRSQIQLLQRVLERGMLSTYPPEKVHKLLESSDRQIDRLSRLINELLDISRARMGRLQLNLEPFDLTEMVRETAERFRDTLATAGCELKILKPEHPIVGNWDRLRLEEVVSNLLTNAAKYAPGKPVELSLSTGKSRAFIAVRDRGPGIAERDQERIFDRFERVVTPKRVGGFGLGLYISREIAQAHGGTLRVKSAQGSGSEFVLELPYSD